MNQRLAYKSEGSLEWYLGGANPPSPPYSNREKESTMSILRLAVESHGKKTGLGIREILAAAYYHKYQKPMPEEALMEDVRRWNHGECNIPYLYDFMLLSR